MSDPLTPSQRHKCMSHIRSKNTRPEVRLRRELFRRGYRYRLHVKGLPGTPDLVLARYRTCIFVNGCFWHGHRGCPKFVLPAAHAEFWRAKIDRNRERDLRDCACLAASGWRTVVVWECELTAAALPATVDRVCRSLAENRHAWLEEVEARRRSRAQWKAFVSGREEAGRRALDGLRGE